MKKKEHTIKVQLIICLKKNKILAIRFGRWKEHDFKILKKSKIKINEESKIIGDTGYEGITKIYKNWISPNKKKKWKYLSSKEKKENKKIAKKRIYIEHINRKCKIFKMLKDVYRGKHKNYSIAWTLVSALVNLLLSSL